MATNLHWINSDNLYSEICRNKKTSYAHEEVEERARYIRELIWNNRKEIWFDEAQVNPVQMLKPAIAAQLIGFNCEEVSSLGKGYLNNNSFEVAGIIDNKQRKIQVSTQFPIEVRNFTLAHELAHAVLHRESGLHRDMPLDGTKLSSNETEREADIFATNFLMPEKLIRSVFLNAFLTDSFVLNQNTAYALGYRDYALFIKRFKNLRQLSRTLASTEQYNSVRFISLSKYFNVSVEAMAIRLEQLNLVRLK
jgi:Zn-dependent peptidase ImmA (M78 family)